MVFSNVFTVKNTGLHRGENYALKQYCCPTMAFFSAALLMHKRVL
jgi:hypothetical protein